MSDIPPTDSLLSAGVIKAAFVALWTGLLASVGFIVRDHKKKYDKLGQDVALLKKEKADSAELTEIKTLIREGIDSAEKRGKELGELTRTQITDVHKKIEEQGREHREALAKTNQHVIDLAMRHSPGE